MSVVVRNETPHVTSAPDVCGGRPVIIGTRTEVRTIVGYYKMGLSIDEIVEGLPHLNPAQIFAALSYYYDHKSEIEEDIADNRIASLMARYGLKLAKDGRLVAEEESGQ
jgi:uncharacterized protein (DUF433 family)